MREGCPTKYNLCYLPIQNAMKSVYSANKVAQYIRIQDKGPRQSHLRIKLLDI